MICLHKQCVGENESSSGDMLNSRERSHQHLHLLLCAERAGRVHTNTWLGERWRRENHVRVPYALFWFLGDVEIERAPVPHLPFVLVSRKKK